MMWKKNTSQGSIQCLPVARINRGSSIIFTFTTQPSPMHNSSPLFSFFFTLSQPFDLTTSFRTLAETLTPLYRPHYKHFLNSSLLFPLFLPFLTLLTLQHPFLSFHKLFKPSSSLLSFHNHPFLSTYPKRINFRGINFREEQVKIEMFSRN